MQRLIALCDYIATEGIMAEQEKDQEQNKNQQVYLLAIAAIVVVILIAAWMLLKKEDMPAKPAVIVPQVVTEPVIIDLPPEPQPEIDNEEAEPEPEVSAQTESVDIVEAPVELPLPALDNSDQEVKQKLLALEWQPGLAGLFITEDMLRNFALQVDNIAQGQLAKKHPLLQPLEQKFTPSGQDAMQLNDESFARFQPYIQLLESVPPAKLITLFDRYEPLLQQAYAEQGYPDELFKNKLITAIEVLLATPDVSYPLPLVRPGVMYKFADPDIEQLPAAQKQMLRLGPANMAKVKAVLRQYHSHLTAV
ncbi:DUF3014 domain-containing protein [Rheinheimera baltica]|uniref:DUF3014 domain-containing protein n=1 Tax=Rheinheimera baltica TaxID=67576 RepID=UPI00273F3999|nr:DUF3014 domain-containing protein [Rheinheimera baltica]MDP5150280.1 DUF3014 domain-containing protein [Rheinheimera baltica]